ncbi:CAP-Gly domain-containing linker protein 4-like [Xenia sp. Carnegie-2017]|uniref:CAP-Gly domain-containing linker protein 4-like n=1 Tax=Xenia sp. Carnegie-2017 TaxID=2897299 RepID=UPI001F04F8CC|nr:CAP-Gly domain-containing linker protein 4-like [Xenia sp. Carnegie-2017]
MPEKRRTSVVHPITDFPTCDKCPKNEPTFFDPDCEGCMEILSKEDTSISEIFAIVRQWVPQVQKNLEKFVHEITRRGGGINDRDGLTDMTLLHYACKSGSVGIGDVDNATALVTELISQGADPSIRCRWTDMLPIHYSAFFNCAPVIRVLLKASGGRDIDATSSGFDNGTILHIAASNLCLDSAKCLLQHGANAFVKDDQNRTALNTIPEANTFERSSPSLVIANKLRRLLNEAETSGSESGMESATDSSVNMSDIIGLKIGDHVIVGGTKMGILRYCGSTDFAKGQWAGVELNDPVGKNDGSVGGKNYFHCKPKHGLFCPVSKISIPKPHNHAIKTRPNSVKLNTNLTRIVPSKRSTSGSLPGSRSSSRSPSPQPTQKTEENTNIKVGDRLVMLNDNRRRGITRYVGETQFSSGLWIGVELDTSMGKNDGSVNGIRYFVVNPIMASFSSLQIRDVCCKDVVHDNEKDVQERPSLAKSKEISISDDAINQPQQTVNDDSGINRDKTKSRLSLLNRRLSNSVPDLTQKRHKQLHSRRESGIPRFKRTATKKNNSDSENVSKNSS